MISRIHLFYMLAALFCTGHAQAQIASPGSALPAWEKGFLDIHHINTGRGNAAYCILPDSTTLLIDAGELSPLDRRTFTKRNAPAKPDSCLKPFEWLVAYIKKMAPSFNPVIDYAILTHFHDDHFGAWYPDAPPSLSGRFRLTGITGVGDRITIRNLADRGYPRYDYPYDLKKQAAVYGGGEIMFDSTMNNYFSFLEEKKKTGMQQLAIQAGSTSQIKLKDPASFPACYIRNVKVNQYIWTGSDSSVGGHFPGIDKANPRTWPDENSLSLAFTIHYGAFEYYTGGDNPGNIFPGDSPYRDVATPIAKAIGEVDVAVMDHHGNRDAINENSIKLLSPAVWIGQTWSADHPGHEVLLRLTNSHINARRGDIFATNMLEANKLVIGPLIDNVYKSQQGHIVVRVLPGGSSYYVIVLDDDSPEMLVKKVVGPYTSKPKNK